MADQTRLVAAPVAPGLVVPTVALDPVGIDNFSTNRFMLLDVLVKLNVKIGMHGRDHSLRLWRVFLMIKRSTLFVFWFEKSLPGGITELSLVMFSILIDTEY